MTVREYLGITSVSKMQFYLSPNNFENIKGIKQKWGGYTFPVKLNKWLDKKISKVFILCDGTARIFTKAEWEV